MVPRKREQHLPVLAGGSAGCGGLIKRRVLIGNSDRCQACGAPIYNLALKHKFMSSCLLLECWKVSVTMVSARCRQDRTRLSSTPKKSRFIFLGNGVTPILSCGERLGGVQEMVMPRDTLDEGDLWVLLPMARWGQPWLGTAVVPQMGNTY